MHACSGIYKWCKGPSVYLSRHLHNLHECFKKCEELRLFFGNIVAQASGGCPYKTNNGCDLTLK